VQEVFGQNSQLKAPVNAKLNKDFADTQTGLEFVETKGQYIRAAAEGLIKEIAEDKENGRFVEIAHGGSVSTRYYGFGEILVTQGQTVKAGDMLGQAAETVRFQVLLNGKYVDPLQYIPTAN
ncbi:M23 family metallopeptidase, partial [Clostridia bacterium OttesenSCG-928-F22]|nr:M23 family metallopeptidase [Clostridia bacterium OttesenSCG-928-F22]